MKVLVAEPMKPCQVREISGLDDMRAIVGGHIQAVYPFQDNVALVCNEEGKNLGLPYNRPLTDDLGIPYDIICGTFFLAGLGAEDFVSLTEEQIHRYKELYDNMAVLTAEMPMSQEKHAVPEKKRRTCPRPARAKNPIKGTEHSMNGDTPINLFGVLASPNDADGGMIRFIDSQYNTLFHVPDGGNIILTSFDDSQSVRACQYIDSYHARIGGETFHICQFAEIQEQKGAVYAPEYPQPGDILDTYTIYQLKNTSAVPYAFMPYEEAKGKLKMTHYMRVYRGVLSPEVTLEQLYEKHNQNSRPFGQRIHSMSMSDVVVLDRGGEKRAFYVDRVGFQEAKRFLEPPVRKKKRSEQER